MKDTALKTQSVVLTDIPKQKSTRKQRDKLPSLKVNGVAKISVRVLEKGIETVVNGKSFRLRYPISTWKRFPKSHKKILSQNIAYAYTFQLPFLYTSIQRVLYSLPVPLSEAFLFKGLSLALPATAIMQTHKDMRVTSNLLRKLYDIDYIYSNQKTEVPPYNRTSFTDHAVMPFTFGKDSLLTFALSRDLGLSVFPVYIAEPYYAYEEYIKKLLAIPFEREFRTRIAILRNTLGVFRDPDGWFGWELQLTQYSLMLLPYVYAKRAGYILFSNEQSCNDTIVDEDGFRCNPVFEQSHSWLLQNSLMASIVGGNSLSIGSLLEPIHEIAIERILHKRYPNIAKYQSSCDLPEKPKSGGRWCENCSKCARMFIFMLANGIDPKSVGFKHFLLRQRDQHLYTLFSDRRMMEFGYDQSEVGRNEQLLAFLMAYKKGVKGTVMRSFVKHFLQKAKKKEKKLRQNFFGIHSSKTIPQFLRPKVLKIYQQELAGLS